MMHRSRDGDTISSILLEYFQRNDDQLEEALHKANPDLNSYGVVLPAGIEMEWPDIPEPEAKTVVNVWD